jgi:hypothetical protein
MTPQSCRHWHIDDSRVSVPIARRCGATVGFGVCPSIGSLVIQVLPMPNRRMPRSRWAASGVAIVSGGSISMHECIRDLKSRRGSEPSTVMLVATFQDNCSARGRLRDPMPVLIFQGTVRTVAVRRYPRPVVVLPTSEATHSVAPHAQERAELGNCRFGLIRQYEVHKLPVFFKHGLRIR